MAYYIENILNLFKGNKTSPDSNEMHDYPFVTTFYNKNLVGSSSYEPATKVYDGSSTLREIKKKVVRSHS